MPIGLTNAPACSKQALYLIVTRFKWKSSLVYLGDVIIFSDTVDDHIRHVDESLATLTDACVTLMINKCHLFQRKVQYLGHMVKPGRLEIDKTNFASLRDAQPPTNETELRSFLSLYNFYRRFIEGFTGWANQLINLLKKVAPNSFGLRRRKEELIPQSYR